MCLGNESSHGNNLHSCCSVDKDVSFLWVKETEWKVSTRPQTRVARGCQHELSLGPLLVLVTVGVDAVEMEPPLPQGTILRESWQPRGAPVWGPYRRASTRLPATWGQFVFSRRAANGERALRMAVEWRDIGPWPHPPPAPCRVKGKEAPQARPDPPLLPLLQESGSLYLVERWNMRRV